MSMNQSRLRNLAPSDAFDQLRYEKQQEELKRQQHLKQSQSNIQNNNLDISANGQKELNSHSNQRQHIPNTLHRAEKENLTCPQCELPMNSSPNNRTVDQYKLEQSRQVPHNCVRSLKEKVESLQLELNNYISQENIASILCGYLSKDDVPKLMKTLETFIEEKLQQKGLVNGGQKSAQYSQNKSQNGYPAQGGAEQMRNLNQQEKKHQAQLNNNQNPSAYQREGDTSLLEFSDIEDDHKANGYQKKLPQVERFHPKFKCTQSHPLKNISDRNRAIQILCSVCKQLSLTVDDHVLSCLECNFNVCQKCDIKITQMNINSTLNRNTGAGQLSCIKSHPFKIQKSNLDKRRCNVCKELSIQNGSYTKNCMECDFDVCQRCDNILQAILSIPQEKIPSSKDVQNASQKDNIYSDQNRMNASIIKSQKYLCSKYHSIKIAPTANKIELSHERCQICSKKATDQAKQIAYCSNCDLVICFPCQEIAYRR